MRSFIIDSSLNTTFTGTDLDVWTIGTNSYWYGRFPLAAADFNVSGFKNINIFGVDLVGEFYSLNTPNNALVQDWNVDVDIIGLPSLIGGEVVPFTNSLGINVDPVFTTNFLLSKYKRTIKFQSPIQSVNQIRFRAYTANGIAPENLLTVDIGWNLNYIFYYKFEGE